MRVLSTQLLQVLTQNWVRMSYLLQNPEAIENKLQIIIDSGDAATDELMTAIIDALNKYIMRLAQKQIQLVFSQSEKEVADLHQRTREGIVTAKLNGKRIGQPKGSKLTTKKSIEAKTKIKKHGYRVDKGKIIFSSILLYPHE